MFTGIITDMGMVSSVSGNSVKRLEIETRYDLLKTPIGASIACNGVCLTVVEKDTDRFAVDVSPTTLQVTTASDWQPGTKLNLEQALKLGDELGGHLVSGHVDAVVSVISRRDESQSSHFEIELPKALAPLVATKGSVVLDGVSLTVTQADKDSFGVTLIPHTLSVTTWGQIQAGNRMNLEVDLVARYLKRIDETRHAT